MVVPVSPSTHARGPRVLPRRDSNEWMVWEGWELGMKGGREGGTLRLTFVLDEVLYLLFDAVTPVGDVHVQGVVTAALPIRPLSPLLIGLCQAGLGLGHHMVN